MINFFCFKWGDKYDYKYVNRLYGSLVKHCKVPFTLTCITENPMGMREEIEWIEYNDFDPFDFPKDQIFTREKLVLFKEFKQGTNVWLDLDLLIHNDITDLVTRDFEKPTFIWNYWNWDQSDDPLRHYGSNQICYVNSSFVAWQDDCGEQIFDHLWEKQTQAFYTYKSLDKYIFYQHWHKGTFETWEPGLWYNYNFDYKPRQMQPDRKGCIFNTSHLKLYKNEIQAHELHESVTWARELWESYDRL